MLREISFDIMSDEPDLTSRRYVTSKSGSGTNLRHAPFLLYSLYRIMFRIFDGKFWSAPAYVTVTIEGINDKPPELSLVPLGVPYVEGTAEGVELLSNATTLTDPDHNEIFNLASLSVSVAWRDQREV